MTGLPALLAELANPTELLHEIFANAPMALQLYARDGRSVFVNPAHTALFGAVPPPEYNVFADTILIERGLVAIIRRAFTGERISIPAIWYDVRDLRGVTLDVSGGRRIAISSEMVPIRDAAGEVSYVLIVFNDHTDAERRAEQSAFLADAGRMLSGSLDLDTTLAQIARLATPALADLVVVDLVDDDGNLRRVANVHSDPAAQPLLDEILERFPPTRGSQQPSSRAIVSGQPELVAVADPDTLAAHALSSEHRALLVTLGVRSHVSVPLVLDTRVLGAITLCFVGNRRYSTADLPFLEALASRAAGAIDHARLYRAAEAARMDAEAASRAKDEFLAMLGHELRNPLAPIVTALELSPARTKEQEIIWRQVGHLRRLVDDLLDVSRITRGTLALELAHVDIADPIVDGLESARPLLDGRQLVIELEPGLFVRGDRARLAQIVTNLLTNAARYTEPTGRIEVRARRRGDEHVIVVRDDGAGMPADLVPRVFETFTRGGRPIDRASGGLGLGLAIVKSLTEKHGGRVAARSEGPGRGSELEIVLPASTARASVAPPPPAPSKRARKGCVLVVDDNVDAAVLLGEALEQAGLTAMIAHDGRRALDAARAQPPRVAIVDIGMPGMNGFDLAIALHALPGLEQLPIIALTGFGQPSDRLRSDRAGFVAHLVKPVQLETILVTLDMFL